MGISCNFKEYRCDETEEWYEDVPLSSPPRGRSLGIPKPLVM